MEIFGQLSGMVGVLLALLPAVKNYRGFNCRFHAQPLSLLVVLI
jgi:hypothetical protein